MTLHDIQRGTVYVIVPPSIMTTITGIERVIISRSGRATATYRDGRTKRTWLGIEMDVPLPSEGEIISLLGAT